MTSSEKVMNFLSSTRFESSRIFVMLHLYGTCEDTKKCEEVQQDGGFRR